MAAKFGTNTALQDIEAPVWSGIVTSVALGQKK